MSIHFTRETSKVLWSELFPYEFKMRLASMPVAYLPLGICEPHGQISALGLDTFKAQHIVQETARRVGGIVAPAMEYHIHESGPSAKFCETHIGENNPHMTSVPPFIFYHMFLYQLRALYHAGFRAVFVLSGHGGSHPQDLRKIANYFKKHADMHIWFGTDFDLVAGKYPGDHAGKYEISTLMYLRPDLVDFSLRSLEKEESSGGMFALNESAMEASAAYGQQIMESCVVSLMELVQSLTPEDLAPREISMLRYEHMELIWQEIVDSDQVWATLQPRSGQPPVSEQSKWKPYEYARLNYLK